MTESTPTGVEAVDIGVETPEADAVEQAIGDDRTAGTPRDIQTVPDAVPEADAVEQAIDDDRTAATPRDVRHIPDDVPVADALEQAYEVELDDDYR